MRPFLTRLLLAAAFAACFPLAACSGGGPFPGATCNSFEIIPPTLTVVDAKTHQSICDATVTGNERGALTSFVTAAAPGASPSGCEYGPAQLDADGGVRGVSSISDSYAVITVQKAGYQSTEVDNVAPQTWGCGSTGPRPAPQQIVVSLVPTN